MTDTTAIDDLAAWLTQVWDEQESWLSEQGGFSPEDCQECAFFQSPESPFSTALLLARIAADRQILAEVGYYEAKIDGEWGCGHGADSILRGECPGISVDGIPILQLLALPYADRPGYREEWRP